MFLFFSERKLRIVSSIISESSILDNVDAERCLRVRSIKDWTRRNYANSKARKQKKKEDEGKNTKQMMNF